MLTLQELSRQISAYELDQLSLDDFEDWFRSNSKGAYASSDVSELAASVEAALSKFYFQRTGEQVLKQDLWNYIRPFVLYAAEEWILQPVQWSMSSASIQPMPPMTAGANNSGSLFQIVSSNSSIALSVAA